MKSGVACGTGVGVLLVAAAQLVVSLSLLGVFEGYKTAYFSARFDGDERVPEYAEPVLEAERAIVFRTPLDFLFWFSCASAISSLLGLAGIFAAQPRLVSAHFGWNLLQSVLALYLFVDVLADKRIQFAGRLVNVTGFEQAAAALLFLTFVLSMASTYVATKAVAELKQKKRESYHEMAVVGDALQFEPDLP